MKKQVVVRSFYVPETCICKVRCLNEVSGRYLQLARKLYVPLPIKSTTGLSVKVPHLVIKYSILSHQSFWTSWPANLCELTKRIQSRGRISGRRLLIVHQHFPSKRAVLVKDLPLASKSTNTRPSKKSNSIKLKVKVQESNCKRYPFTGGHSDLKFTTFAGADKTVP